MNELRARRRRGRADDLRSGREPFGRIMGAKQALPAGHVLRVRAIFEPAPLYRVLGKDGFAHFTERLAADDWRVWFYRAEEERPSGPLAADPGTRAGVVVLDVRGMEPPEPMVRTLAALEALPPGGTLVQVNMRLPRFLLPKLEEAGFEYEVREQDDELVRVFIRLKGERPAGDHDREPEMQTVTMSRARALWLHGSLPTASPRPPDSPPMSLTRRELLKIFGSAGALAAAVGASGCLPGTREEAVHVGAWRKSVCRFCGSGCETMVGITDGRVVKVEGHQAGWNRGRLCIKGLLNREILYVEDRALHPMVRSGGRLVRATWDEALDAAAEGFLRAIEAGGPDSVAFYGSGQLFTQESYTANKLFKAGIGTNNVERNPRLCMASAAAGYTTTFGADEPTGCYRDIDHATLFFVIGANMAECHPVVWELVQDRRRTHPGTRIIVVDPRRTPTARQADQHLQLRPGTDVALLNAMCLELVEQGLVDRGMVEEYLTFRRDMPDTPELSWDQFVAHLEPYRPERAAELCGLGAEEIREAARWFGIADAAMSFWTMGLNQQSNGTGANRMMNALHLITGQLGRMGTGAFSLTGQPNAGGGVRDTGSLSHALPLGGQVRRAEDQAKWERAWGVPAGRISPEPGLHTIALFDAMLEGRVNAALVMCTNPAHSLPNADRYRPAMERAFLVVADAIYPTHTTERRAAGRGVSLHPHHGATAGALAHLHHHGADPRDAEDPHGLPGDPPRRRAAPGRRGWGCSCSARR